MTRWIFAPLTAVALTGCFLPAPASKTFGPTGKPGYSINCPGLMNNWGACYERAGDLCGVQGYDIVVLNGEPVDPAAPPKPPSGGAMSRSIVVQCRATPT